MSDTGPQSTFDPNVGAAVFRSLAGLLNNLGLGPLFSYANGQPSGRLWEWIKSGLETEGELYFMIEQTPEFDAQYGVVKRMRQASVSNPAIPVPSVADVRQYRQSFAELLRYYRLPPTFYDQAADADAMMEKGIPIQRVQAAMEEGWERVRESPTAVQQAFTAYYGPNGDSQLAAFFMDPDRIEAGVGRFVTAARFGGFAQSMGMGALTKGQAETAAGLAGDMTEGQLRDVMSTASTAQRASRFGAEEGGGDVLSAQEAIMDVGLDANVATRERLAARLANRRGQITEGGAAAVDQSGVRGLRSGGGV